MHAKAHGREVPVYDPRYLQGIEHFNNREFFEAHEVWEEIWHEVHGAERDFYKGLIQAAVCLHHMQNGNYRGTQKLFRTSKGYLAGYGPRHRGIDLAKLAHDMAACCEPYLRHGEEHAAASTARVINTPRIEPPPG